jgi:hypothetical protein
MGDLRDQQELGIRLIRRALAESHAAITASPGQHGPPPDP